MDTRLWHTLSIGDVTAQLGADPAQGLSGAEARRRLDRSGPNRLRAEKKEPIWEVFFEEIREPMILLLLVTGVLYSLWGRLEDALTIFTVIVILVAVEVYNEYRAEKAVAALSKLAELTAPVLRDGAYGEVPVEQVVPGDLVLLQAGRRVPADARLLEAYGLAADESALTGEAVPADKQADVVLAADAPLAERRNLVFAGSAITRGRGTALIVATGMQTELGRIAGLARALKPPKTSLQQAMRQLSQGLVWLALAFSVLVPLLGWLLAGQPLRQMLLTGLSLAFATIPEELPIIITMVLALGAFRLSRQQAIVKRLQAVETLGAVTVIATDKTGTLTENRMRLSSLYPEAQQAALLELGVLSNGAVESGGATDGRGLAYQGDPLDVALLEAAHAAGIDVPGLRHTYPLCQEFTFDNARKLMSDVYQRDDRLWVVAKGAPEAILTRAGEQRDSNGHAQTLTEAARQAALDQAAEMARQGLRVIALAEKTVADRQLDQAEAESDLCFVGLAGFVDPPRPEVRQAIAACRSAGIRPLMVTGDHPLTARAVAAEIGLDGNAPVLSGPELDRMTDEQFQEAVGQVSIYARTTPEHKLRIVQALQAQGERVAVTGDGVNDAPALAAADIGVAMGETGTDVAREAGDMVLADDNFATIVRAVREGRLLFANLQKGVRYYLACKVALISASLLPVLLRVPVPFAPVQIILMELFMDLAASATFVAEPPEGDLMHRPPRDPRRSFMDRAMVGGILASAAGLFAAVSVAYLVTWYRSADLVQAQTMAFLTWLLGHVFLAINLRSERQPLLRLGPFSNRLMTFWAVAALAFVVFVTLVPPVRQALKLALPSDGQWALAVGAAALGTFWMEAGKWLRHSHDREQTYVAHDTL